ncbi:MAG: hypothetical protein HYZ28_07270 [Myxococcales bacterium]|nr:hypothetical protein [Myxococcales bacterium]
MTLAERAPGPDSSVLAGVASKVRALIASGDTKGAVEQAKQAHALQRSPESEALAVEAYRARIDALRGRGLNLEADQLAALCQKRFRSASAAAPSALGRLDELARLVRTAATEHERLVAQATLREQLSDPRDLLRCPSLAEDDPLRLSAAAVATAFERATSAPIAEGELREILSAVARKSPLAPWKLLAHAIALLHRRDDGACASVLAMIDPASPPARLVPAVTTVLRGGAGAAKGEPPPSPASAALVDQVLGRDPRLRECLGALDAAFEKKKPKHVYRAIEEAVLACKKARPDLLEQLRQRISVRAMMADLPVPRVREALGGASTKDARFWRLYAQGHERIGHQLGAAAAWQEFLRLAPCEGWFAPHSAEAAAVWLHAAELLSERPPGGRHRGSAESDQGEGDTSSHLEREPGKLFEKAAAADPCADTYQRWYVWEKKARGKVDRVAQEWRRALPQDARPLVLLAESAEERGASMKALGFVEQAEKLDPLEPIVRRARVRLLFAGALRHLRARKPALALDELAAIDAMPEAKEGERPTLVTALRWLLAVQKGDEREAAAHRERAEASLGPVGGTTLLRIVAGSCNYPVSPGAEHGPESILEAAARLASLDGEGGEHHGLEVELPSSWQSRLVAELTGRDESRPEQQLLPIDPGEVANRASAPGKPLDGSRLRKLAGWCLRAGWTRVAYAAAGAGLAAGGAACGRFLFLRARSLPPALAVRRAHCFLAAAELARRHRDEALAGEVAEAIADGGGLDLTAVSARHFSLPPAAAEAVVQRELEARTFPSESDDEREYLDACRCELCRMLTAPCDCPTCRSRRLDEQDGEDIFELDDEPLGDIPPQALSVILEYARKHGPPRKLDNPGAVMDEMFRKDPRLAQRLLNVLERAMPRSRR